MTLHQWHPPGSPDEPVAKRIGTIAAEFIARHPELSPFLLIDRGVLLGQLARWNRLLPTVPPYYAVKANIDPVILRELFEAGANADVASAFEIDVCRAVGVPGERMIVSNPRKDRDTILSMRDIRAFATAVDSEEEIDKLTLAGMPSRDYQPVLFIRIKVPTKGVTQDLSSKFGVRVLPPKTDPTVEPLPPVQLDAVRSIAKHARSAGFTKIGLSFHVGTQCSDPRIYVSALRVCRSVIDDLASDGIRVGWLDIGGGFADLRTLAARGTDVETLLREIGRAVARFTGTGIQLLAEPGRHLVADAGWLVTSVTYDRATDVTGRRVQIDDGVYRTLSGRIHDDREYQLHALRCGGLPFTGVTVQAAVWGCSCDSFDKVSDAVVLPADVQIGDRLIAGCLGAYSTSFGSNTNGFQPAPSVLFSGESGDRRFVLSPMRDQNAVLLKHIGHWAGTGNPA